MLTSSYHTMSEPSSTSLLQKAALWCRRGLLCLLFIVAWSGLWLLSAYLDGPFNVSLFYGPAGLSLAMFLRYGWLPLPLVLIASQVPVALMWGDRDAIALSLSGLVHGLTYCGFAVLLRWVGFRGYLRAPRDIGLLLVGALLSPSLAAALGADLYTVDAASHDFLLTWRNWWLGDMNGIIALTPVLLLALAAPGRRPVRINRWHWLLALPLFGACLVLAGLVPGLSASTHWMLLAGGMLATAVAAALASGLRGAILANPLMAALLIGYLGLQNSATDQHLELQLSLMAASTVSLILGSFVSGLWHSQGEIEGRVQQRVEDIAAQEQMFRLVAEQAPDIIALFDCNLRLLYISPALRELLGYDPEEAIANQAALIRRVNPDDRRNGALPGPDDLAAQGKSRWRFRMLDAHGQWRWIESLYTPIQHNDELHYLCISRDVSEQTAQHEHWVSQAMHDPLTQLYNRRALEQEGGEELRRARRYRNPMALMLLDIDHFKRVNDTYGHDIGDQVIQHLASTLTLISRDQEILCRWGGEEFLVLLPETDLEGAEHYAERIRAEVAGSLLKLPDNRDLRYTVSIGATALSETDDELATLIERADRHLYKAKEAGRNCVIAQ